MSFEYIMLVLQFNKLCATWLEYINISLADLLMSFQCIIYISFSISNFAEQILLCELYYLCELQSSILHLNYLKCKRTPSDIHLHICN